MQQIGNEVANTPTGTTKNESSKRRSLYCLLSIISVSLIFILSYSFSPSSSSSFGILNHNRKQKTQIQINHLNQYLLHLDLTAPQSQREQLVNFVQSNPIFNSLQNVNVVRNPDFSNPKGSSSISSVLHTASLLLRFSSNWDWFINLSSSDYPLISQDAWRIRKIVVDQGLFLTENSDIFYATQKSELPKAYRLFTGSASTILSRKLVEHCIVGSENLPRTVLMYLSNTPSSQANYFQTVVCNSREFSKTILDEMIDSGAVFGTGFILDESVLDHIDQEVLKRRPGRILPGGWCLGDYHNIVRPGVGSTRLEKLLVRLLSSQTFQSRKCMVE
ncbi:hypothetical protein MKX01_041961 [Papaver californicum]|nr:hypothetical protein MKX01_041961 [Papaver californicum]